MSSRRLAARARVSRGYGRGAAVLSIGIGTTGLVTFGYFALASHALSATDYGGIALLWSVVFVTASVIWRPVEQFLSRSIADCDARGVSPRPYLASAGAIQVALAGLFVAVALLLRGPLEEGLFGDRETLYWILLATVVAYAASYFARGFLAGHGRFGLYGGLVLLEATSRCAFALAAVSGVTHGQTAVALGMVAAPLVSLAVVPWGIRRVEAPAITPPAARPAEGVAAGLRSGTGFAGALVVIMACEQTFLNAGPLLVKLRDGATGAALAGQAFNVLLIARAPLQLFQAIQTSILPHLTRLRAHGERESFARSVAATIALIGAFAAAVASAMAVAGPQLMALVFGGDYERLPLVVMAVGMGIYLAAATLNQAVLAAGRAASAAACWLAALALFTLALVAPLVDDRILHVTIAYTLGALALMVLLARLARASAASPDQQAPTASDRLQHRVPAGGASDVGGR
ncbi:lipopolysaccharide biosynthesis protein [Thermoleophilum album]|uniref:lipopolysaccharide biosynthesis protein n=1 Tax=Thermoleophilum album TaxID=29539 RepID=UPI0015A6DD79|nr:hypothetical protein [Thermoleophilum album]